MNLFNLDYNTKESDILDFYKSLNIKEVNMRQIAKGVADIRLASKDDALKLVEIGRGVFFSCFSFDLFMFF